MKNAFWFMGLVVVSMLLIVFLAEEIFQPKDELKDRIEQVLENQEEGAFSLIKMEPESKSIQHIYQIRDSEQKNIGYIYLVEENGYHGNIQVLVRLKEEKIQWIDLLHEEETKGYGSYIREPWFLERFQGITTGTKLSIVKMAPKEMGDIVAVTGATISSQAVADAVQMVLNHEESKQRE